MARLKPEGVMDGFHKLSSLLATLAAISSFIPALIPWQPVIMFLSAGLGGGALAGNAANKK